MANGGVRPTRAGGRGPLRLIPLVLVVGVMTALAPVPAASGAAGPVPGGFRVVSQEVVDPGVEHLALRRDAPPLEVHVARLSAAARSRVRAVLAAPVLSGSGAGLERTSAMCTRVRCAVAVNGDFTDPSGQPVGAMVSAGELVTTPGAGASRAQVQLDASGRPSVGDLRWSVELRTAEGRSVAAEAVNRPLGGEGVVVYTTRWGATTGTDGATLELVVAVDGAGRAKPLPGGATSARLVALHAGGNGPLSPGTVVLAGRGAGAARLLTLWERAATLAGGLATLRVSTGGATESVGGSPRLLSGGAPAHPASDPTSFVQGRHPRTMVGVSRAGELLLVTVDGRQPGRSEGVSLAEAASILAGLGAVEGVNVDGGGSTTFAVRGAASNRPSDVGGERSVSSALVVEQAGLLESLLGR